MMIENSVSGPDLKLSLDKLYRGDTRQILELYVAGADLPMGCAVSWLSSETLAAGEYPLKCTLTARQTDLIATPAAFSAATRTVLGVFTGKVAGTPKGVRNTTYLYVGTTTKVPGYHALSGEVVYVVVKGPCFAYVSGVTSNVAVGSPLTTAYGGAAADLLGNGQFALSYAAVTNAYAFASLTSGGAVTANLRTTEHHRFVALQASTFQSVAHQTGPVRSTGAGATLILVNY
jgi:hypothetical protein